MFHQMRKRGCPEMDTNENGEFEASCLVWCEKRMDELVAAMNRPGSAAAVRHALFADAESLNKAYRPDVFVIDGNDFQNPPT